MKIMVGYDGSNVSKDALTLAKEHAKAFNAFIHIVTSIDKGSEGETDEITDAEGALEYAKSLIDADSVECQTHLLVRGLSTGEDLIDFAKEKEIDEIVIGIKKRSKVGKFLMGSTAQYVILNAECPVLTVR